jgi:hypothetical protein
MVSSMVELGIILAVLMVVGVIGFVVCIGLAMAAWAGEDRDE